MFMRDKLKSSFAMKWSTTTPFVKIVRSSVLIAVAVLVVLATPSATFANHFETQISSLQTQIDSYRAEAKRLNDQAATLQVAIAAINAEKAAVQAQIDVNQVKYEQLQSQIASTQAKIDQQQEFLGQNLADLYVQSSISPLEMLASSNSIGDFIDKQQYRSAISENIKTSIDMVQQLKNQLEQQKVAVEKLLADQKVQRDLLAAKESEQARLLSVTRGQEASYQDMISRLKTQKAAAEAALASSLNSGSYKVSPVGPVSVGGIVGSVGSSGLSSGPHLHLEVRVGGNVTDPAPYIKTNPVNMPPGYVSQSYGNPDRLYARGYHPGTDYATSSGAPIFAIDSGYLYRGCSDQMLGTTDNAYGYVAIVEHANGAKSVYAHMSGGPAQCNYNTWYR